MKPEMILVLGLCAYAVMMITIVRVLFPKAKIYTEQSCERS